MPREVQAAFPADTSQSSAVDKESARFVRALRTKGVSSAAISSCWKETKSLCFEDNRIMYYAFLVGKQLRKLTMLRNFYV